jgi:signal transduction histidine kinase
VTKLKAQERTSLARAEASERLNAQIVEGLTSGLLVAGGDGRIRMLSPAGHRILGIAPRPMPADIAELLQDVPALAALVRDAVNDGRTAVSRRHVATGLVGGPSHLGVTLSPWVGGAAGETGVICLFTDLSRVVTLEEQLRLKDALARLGELTAGLAHEFRNGLATIHGYSRLLDLEHLPEVYRPYVSGIRSETEELGQVVTNFLNFAKPTQLIMGTVDMATVVDRGADDIRAEVEARGGELVIRGEFARVDGDDVLLRQAISNLFRNALEACVGAGITPRIAADGSIDRDQKTLRVVVSDNGPGISPTVAERMFRPFFTTKARGTGLGLALVQKIIVTHNGRVSVQSEPGAGTRFVVSLPMIGESSA